MRECVKTTGSSHGRECVISIETASTDVTGRRVLNPALVPNGPRCLSRALSLSFSLRCHHCWLMPPLSHAIPLWLWVFPSAAGILYDTFFWSK